MRGKRFGRKKNSKSGAFDKRYKRRHSNRHAQDGIMEAYVGTTDVHHHQKSKSLQHILFSFYSFFGVICSELVPCNPDQIRQQDNHNR